MKKIKTLLVLSGLAVSVLAGCGTQTTSSKDPVTSDSSSLTTSSSEAKVLNSIRIASEPTKKNYFVGDEFDPAGLSVKAVYSTGEEDLAATDYQLSGFDSATAGEKTVTVTFQTFTATFKVTVAEVVLESIRVAANPTKVAYYQGEEFDAAGIQVKAAYNNGSERDVAVADLAFSGFNSNVSGDQTITVTYQEKTATFTVNVIAQNGIEVTAAPTKTRYGIGDEFNAAGLKVSRTFADGGKRELATTDYQLSGFDSTTAGEKTITVTAGAYTAEFKVNVYNNEWTAEDKEVWEGEDADLLFEIPYYFGFELGFDGIPSEEDPEQLDVGWYTARTAFPVTNAEYEEYLDSIDGMKTTVIDEDTGKEVEKFAWSQYKTANGKKLTEDVDLLGFAADSDVYQYVRWSHDDGDYFAFQIMSVGLDEESKLLVAATQCIYPFRAYAKENHASYVQQSSYNMVEDMYYLMVQYNLYVQYGVPLPEDQDDPYFDFGLEIPGFDSDTYCFYINEAANSPYTRASVFSKRFNISDFSLIYGTGKDGTNGDEIPYTQADLDAILAKYTARNIEVKLDDTTYSVPVYSVEFTEAGLTLYVEYYIINGRIRIDVEVKDYKAPVSQEMSPLEAITFVANKWNGASSIQQDTDGSYYVVAGFSAANYSVARMKTLVKQIMIPNGFELALDWTAGQFTNGPTYERCVYVNGANTVLQFYVYSSQFSDGTAATVLQVLAFTVEED